MRIALRLALPRQGTEPTAPRMPLIRLLIQETEREAFDLCDSKPLTECRPGRKECLGRASAQVLDVDPVTNYTYQVADRTRCIE